MKLVHLSDLHFGTEQPALVDVLLQKLKEINPDMVIISGDFTQLATGREFRIAQDFIQSHSVPVFCVPGNHDISRFSLYERLFNPYKRYKRYINDNLCPVYESDCLVVAGLNSARGVLPHWNWANGAISSSQLDHLRDVYAHAGSKRRVCVFHHPVHRALDAPLNTKVFGALDALKLLNELRVDLVLTGHVHHASVTTLGDIDHKTVFLSASTALSSRLREQENGFNVISFSPEKFVIEICIYDGANFTKKEEYTHIYTA